MNKFVCEILSKPIETTQIVEIRKGFLRNGVRFAQKYLSQDESSLLLCDKITTVYKKVTFLLLNLDRTRLFTLELLKKSARQLTQT
jgi:hypothetical protein